MDKKRPSLDEAVKAVIEEAIKANPPPKPPEDKTEEVVEMLVSLFEQNQDIAKAQSALLEKLLKKEPVQVTQKEVTLPALMEVEVLNPVKELDIKKPTWLELPNIKGFFD